MLRRALARRGVLVIDGPTATALEAQGKNLDDPLWSAKILLEDPDALSAVHLAYFRAGADVAVTASYQASIAGFCRRGLSPEAAAEMIARSAHLARAARATRLSEQPQGDGPALLVGGSLGSYGAYLADGSEYRGDFDVTEAALCAFHLSRMRPLAPLVDFFAGETVPCLREVRALIAALAQFPQTEAWVSLSLGDGERLASGEPLAEAARLLHAAPTVTAFGVNCLAPDRVSEALRVMAGHSDKPLLAYPNSGEVYRAHQRWHGRVRGFTDPAVLDLWYDLGLRLVGGCCRTSVADIAALHRWRVTKKHQ